MSELECKNISVVIPLYNENASISILYTSLTAVMRSIGRPYEIIFVDDGSTDDAISTLRELQIADSNVRGIRINNNMGQSFALGKGIVEAKGEVIITMDGDLQNDPRDIPNLLKKMEEGYDVVSGWRRHRKDNFFTRVMPSMVANKIISVITGVQLHDYGCSLKAYRKHITQNLPSYGEFHRFAPALSLLENARVVEMEVNHRPRLYGRSKYGFGRIWKVIPSLIKLYFLMKVYYKSQKSGKQKK
ncbi:MAG: glycosyltransferase family 2 protein [Candidatus Omnitrophica bacterium]|nr:glycosyltransferase family 2 protein [Candidatus Omnitrophota bacterium]